MIKRVINQLPLKKKVYLLVALSAIFSLIISISSYTIIQQGISSQKKFNLYLIEKDTSNQIYTSAVELANQVQIFTNKGHNAAAETVQTIYLDIKSKIVSRPTSDSGYSDEHWESVLTHFNNYYKAFLSVKRNRQIRITLVEVKLRDVANKVELEILELITALNNKKENRERKLLNEIYIFLLQVEKSAYRYFDTYDSNDLKDARSSLIKASLKLKELSKIPHISNHILSIKTHMDLYQAVFSEAIQRTLGYMYLTNVVMAAETYEVKYLTKKIVREIDAKMIQLKNDAATSMRTSIFRLVLITIIILALLYFVGFRVIRSITYPINKLANTFLSLSKGKTEIQVAAHPVSDELGQLTDAALVFKEKNCETEMLLDKTNALKVELQRSNDELQQFVYTVSHDLKTPIVTTMGFVGIAQKLANEGKFEQVGDKLDRIVVANKRMSQLIDDLLMLSRVGRVDLDMKDIALEKLLAKFKHEQQADLDRLNFTLKLTPNLPTIYGNESRILQVFENILSNALKYVSNNEASLTISSTHNNLGNYIHLKDNGPGIPERFHQKIFGLFYRLRNRSDGTGIGLAVVQKV
ncbi:MAG: HAMP domain-containing histidine kinase, partial [Bdellovibrionales bacterium]|nr:HAMP domain-containing histidine kinase [Bdellovibrionales bacterium]